MIGFLIQQLHHLKALLSSRTHTATGTLLWVTLLLQRNVTASPSIMATLHSSALTAFIIRYKWWCSAQTKWCDFFLAPLLTITVNEFSLKNLFVAVFSLLCNASMFWRSCQNLLWRPNQFGSQRIGLWKKKPFFKSGRGCHLRKCMHTYFFSREKVKRGV